MEWKQKSLNGKKELSIVLEKSKLAILRTLKINFSGPSFRELEVAYSETRIEESRKFGNFSLLYLHQWVSIGKNFLDCSASFSVLFTHSVELLITFGERPEAP